MEVEENKVRTPGEADATASIDVASAVETATSDRLPMHDWLSSDRLHMHKNMLEEAWEGVHTDPAETKKKLNLLRTVVLADIAEAETVLREAIKDKIANNITEFQENIADNITEYQDQVARLISMGTAVQICLDDMPAGAPLRIDLDDDKAPDGQGWPTVLDPHD